MGKKLITATPAFRMIAPVIRGGSDPSRGPAGNPEIIRNTYSQQHFTEVPGRGPATVDNQRGTRTLLGSLTGASTGATGEVTVANNTFLGPTSLLLGEYTLTTGVDFEVGGGVNATATNLGAAIDLLEGYSTSVVGPAVTITGPSGPVSNEVKFQASGVSPANFTLDPAEGSLSGGSPTIGPPVIT